MENVKKMVLSVTECAAEMRKHGIPCSTRNIGDAIANGIYPFGRVKCEGATGRRTFEIWRVDFEAWLRSKGCEV